MIAPAPRGDHAAMPASLFARLARASILASMTITIAMILVSGCGTPRDPHVAGPEQPEVPELGALLKAPRAVDPPCAEVQAAFDAEASAIRRCSSDSECGKSLMGTSCGCTRNWVARLDADTTRFYQLIDHASSTGCELPLGSTCDCPPADGFVCVDGMCRWKRVPNPPMR